MVDSSSNHRYHCCCGCHVHNLTIAIAIIGILLNIGASIGNYKTGTYGWLWMLCKSTETTCRILYRRSRWVALLHPSHRWQHHENKIFILAIFCGHRKEEEGLKSIRVVSRRSS